MLLRTKIAPPHLRQTHIPRPRLLEKLNHHDGITLVNAPAGWGKTHLVSEWIAQTDLAVAWLSLDVQDNSPTTFIDYLLAAIRSACPQLGLAERLYDFETTIKQLINAATECPDLVLILDDIHQITDDTIIAGLNLLFAYRPHNMRIVLMSRGEPRMSLGRLRAQGGLLELQAGDLRFTAQEAGSFYQDVAELSLSEEVLSDLRQRIEGWAAGMQLVALALQAPSGKLKHLAAGEHYVFDYLAQEVFASLSPDQRDFLVQTSILDQLHPELCDTLTERDDSAVMLEALRRQNLFIFALGDQWYRYHSLFAEFLQRQLSAPNLLHSRAAQWFASQNDYHPAIEHALAGADYSYAAELVEQVAPKVAHSLRVESLEGWLQRLPDEEFARRPYLALTNAWALLLLNRLEEIPTYISLMETSLGVRTEAVSTDQPREVRHLLAGALNVRGFVARLTEQNMERAAEFAQLALDNLPVDAIQPRSSSALNLGVIKRCLGEAAEESFETAVQIAEPSGYLLTLAIAHYNLAAIQAERGDVAGAHARLQYCLAMAAQHHEEPIPLKSMLLVGLGEHLREMGKLAEAEAVLESGLAAAQHDTTSDPTIMGSVSLAKVHLAYGDAQTAAEIISPLQFIKKPNIPWHAVILDTCRVDIWRATNNQVALRHFINAQPQKLSYLRFLQRVAQAHARWILGEPIQRSLLNEPMPVRYRIELLILTALQDNDLSVLQQALALAEPCDFVRLIADFGDVLLPLLYQARDAFPEYVSILIAAIAGETDLLTVREQEILRLIAQGHSNPAIAEHLVIALSTVKTHINNIYRKLGVTGRTKAILVAQERGLL